MKIPVAPPSLREIVVGNDEQLSAEKIVRIAEQGIGPAPDGKYRHWDTLRRIHPPEGLTVEEWWAAIKLARMQMRRLISLKDGSGRQFSYTIPDPLLQMLHKIGRDASGQISLPEPVTNPHTRDRYVQRSLVEEAITSSQLEGAAATREVAKEMIRSGRQPRDKSERMILNNYQAMHHVKRMGKILTRDSLVELHSVITYGTLDDRDNYFREPGDGIAVYENTSNLLLHTPPPASEIEERLAAMCQFANEDAHDVFLHPVVKAIVLHFWLAYDHPFIDGNGRTARALFYWFMIKEGFWLFEYISISSILRKAPARYAKSFLYTETDDNDLTYFILSQLNVICRAIEELQAYLARKVKELQETAQLLRSSADLNHRQLALLTHALRHPGQRYTIKSHLNSHHVVYQTARTDLLDLAEKGLLEQRRMGNKFVFIAADNLSERLRNLR